MGDSDSELEWSYPEKDLSSRGRPFDKIELIPDLMSCEVIRELVPPTILPNPKIWWDNHKAKFQFNLEPDEVESLWSNPEWDLAIQVLQFASPDGPLQKFSGKAVLKIEGKSCDLDIGKSLGKSKYMKRLILRRFKQNPVVVEIKCSMAYEEGIPETLPTLVVTIRLVEEIETINAVTVGQPDESGNAQQIEEVVNAGGESITELEVINRTHIPKQQTLKQIKDLIEDYPKAEKDHMKISVICPLTKTRLVQPVKYSTCVHVECFELSHFLHVTATDKECALNKCPICKTQVKLEDLKVDDFCTCLLNEADANGKRDVSSAYVRVYLNGNWEWEQGTSVLASPVEVPRGADNTDEIHETEAEVVKVVVATATPINSRVNFQPIILGSSEPAVNVILERPAIAVAITLAYIYKNIVDRRLPGHVKVSVICKLNGRRMTFPAKFRTCTHLECFDLEAYFRAKRTFVIEMDKCPICRAEVKDEDLALDAFLSSTLRIPDRNNDLNMEATSLVIFPSGQWIWDKSSIDAEFSTLTFEEKSVRELLGQIARRLPIPKQIAIRTIDKKAKRYGRDSLILQSTCSVFGRRIFRPARFATCLHAQTFDLEPFLTTINLKTSPLWANCPLCNAPRELEDLRLDELFTLILHTRDRNGVKDQNTAWVRIFGNGEWEWTEDRAATPPTNPAPAPSRPTIANQQQQARNASASTVKQSPQRKSLPSHERLMNEVVRRTKIKKEVTLQRVRKIIKQDSEMTGLSYLRVGVKCPITTSRLTNPVRFRTCTHVHCFELDAFLKMVRASTKFSYEKCPICETEVRFSDLMMDEIFESILRIPDKKGLLDKECGFVRIYEDGAWEWDTPKSKTVKKTQAINIIDSDADADDDDWGDKDIGSTATKAELKDPLTSKRDTVTPSEASRSDPVSASKEPELEVITIDDDDNDFDWGSDRNGQGQPGSSRQAQVGPSSGGRSDNNNNPVPVPSTSGAGSKRNEQPQPPGKTPTPPSSLFSQNMFKLLNNNQHPDQSDQRQAAALAKHLALGRNSNNANAVNRGKDQRNLGSRNAIQPKLSKKMKRKLAKQRARELRSHQQRQPPRLPLFPPPRPPPPNNYQDRRGNAFNFNSNNGWNNGPAQWAPNPHSWNQNQAGPTTVVTQMNVNCNWNHVQPPPPLMSQPPPLMSQPPPLMSQLIPPPAQWSGQNAAAAAWERANVGLPRQ